MALIRLTLKSTDTGRLRTVEKTKHVIRLEMKRQFENKYCRADKVKVAKSKRYLQFCPIFKYLNEIAIYTSILFVTKHCNLAVNKFMMVNK